MNLVDCIFVAVIVFAGVWLIRYESRAARERRLSEETERAIAERRRRR